MASNLIGRASTLKTNYSLGCQDTGITLGDSCHWANFAQVRAHTIWLGQQTAILWDIRMVDGQTPLKPTLYE